jgi:hypothetical protein
MQFPGAAERGRQAQAAVIKAVAVGVRAGGAVADLLGQPST